MVDNYCSMPGAFSPYSLHWVQVCKASGDCPLFVDQWSGKYAFSAMDMNGQ